MRKVFYVTVVGAVVAAGALWVGGSLAGNERHAAVGSCVHVPLKGLRIIDERTVVINDNHDHSAVVRLSGPCADGDANDLQVRVSPASRQICNPIDADVINRFDAAMPKICSIRSIEVMTRADAEAHAPDQGVW